MPGKVKLATVWLQGCSGCHIALLDLHQGLLELLDKIDLMASPIMDIKRVPEVDVVLVEGAVGNEENRERLLEARAKAKILVALGTCANFGGVVGLRNLYQAENVLERAYVDSESTVDGLVPGQVPALLQNVLPIDRVVKVDAYIPGCPPTPKMIKESVEALLEGRRLTLPSKSLCDQCQRQQNEMLKPQREFVTENVVSLMELEEIAPNKCFLEQGILCMGPATRSGCEERCLNANVPCRGCMGPVPGALEQGAKMINALSTILPAGALMWMEDTVGTGYRYSLPVSIIPGVRKENGRG